MVCNVGASESLAEQEAGVRSFGIPELSIMLVNEITSVEGMFNVLCDNIKSDVRYYEVVHTGTRPAIDVDEVFCRWITSMSIGKNVR